MEKISPLNPSVTNESGIDKESERLEKIEELKKEPGVKEISEKPKPIEFTTAKGSVYTYLPDGRTKRFKTIENETNDIQDVCVFIPPYEKISAEAKKFYPHIFGKVETQHQFLQILLTYAQIDGYTIRVIDDKQNELRTVSDIANADRVFMALINKKNPKNSITLPVSKEPKVGYNVFDTRKYLDEKGNMVRERHIGNKVIEIKYQN